MKNYIHNKNTSCSPTNSRQLQDEYISRFAAFIDNSLNKPIKKDTRLKDLEPLPTFVWVGNRIFKYTDVSPTIKSGKK